jgi:succinate dehydrogenase / fumarate reductase membrane anchor subunit
VRAYAKNPVGAHYGLGDWLLQRLTAVVMLLYTVFMLAAVLLHSPGSYDDWRRIFTHGAVRIATMLFFVALLYHAWVGMRDILMDYVRATGLRLALQFGVGLLLVVYLIWAASILWGIPKP